MSATWARILARMVDRGTCTQATLDGALRTWHQVTDAEHAELTARLRARQATDAAPAPRRA